MVAESYFYNPLTWRMDLSLDPASVSDGKPDVRDASGWTLPTTTASDRWLISVAGTLGEGIGAVVPWDLIAYDATTDIWTKLAALYVNLLTAQSIDWVKTFTSSPIVPNPTNNTDATNKQSSEDFAVAMAASL